MADGQPPRMVGIYWRNAMPDDDGMGFSLVPWKQVIEQRMGQQPATTVRDGGVSWEFRR